MNNLPEVPYRGNDRFGRKAQSAAGRFLPFWLIGQLHPLLNPKPALMSPAHSQPFGERQNFIPVHPYHRMIGQIERRAEIRRPVGFLEPLPDLLLAFILVKSNPTGHPTLLPNTVLLRHSPPSLITVATTVYDEFPELGVGDWILADGIIRDIEAWIVGLLAAKCVSVTVVTAHEERAGEHQAKWHGVHNHHLKARISV